jgi:hypothetical protein
MLHKAALLVNDRPAVRTRSPAPPAEADHSPLGCVTGRTRRRSPWRGRARHCRECCIPAGTGRYIDRRISSPAGPAYALMITGRANRRHRGQRDGSAARCYRPGDQLSSPELEFGRRWRPMIDQVGGDGGQARAAKSLNWTTSTVSRDYKGDTLPTDERQVQLCHALQVARPGNARPGRPSPPRTRRPPRPSARLPLRVPRPAPRLGPVVTGRAAPSPGRGTRASTAPPARPGPAAPASARRSTHTAANGLLTEYGWTRLPCSQGRVRPWSAQPPHRSATGLPSRHAAKAAPVPA